MLPLNPSIPIKFQLECITQVPVNFEVKLRTDLDQIMLLWRTLLKMKYTSIGQCIIKLLAGKTFMDYNFEGLLVIIISTNIKDIKEMKEIFTKRKRNERGNRFHSIPFQIHIFPHI